MKRDTRFTPPFIPTESAATASVSTLRMVERLFNIEQGRWKTALDEWENEGGSVATDSAQVPFSIDMKNGS